MITNQKNKAVLWQVKKRDKEKNNIFNSYKHK